MLRQLFAMMLLLGLFSVVGTGCCCVQGMPGGACGTAGCGGGCPPGPLLGFASCRGACGETYVDEWVSEPPVVDNCGPDCGGCSRCYQPVRSALRQLWGRPYLSQCGTGLCGPSCGECDGADEYIDVSGDDYPSRNFYGQRSGMAAPQRSCNCGSSGHADHYHEGSAFDPSFDAGGDVPAGPPAAIPQNGVPKLAPEIIPTPEPAPSVAPTSATRRLNPAFSRRR